MDKRMVEWVLARLSSRERASEIVGDLLEQSPGRAEFLWAVVRVVFAMTWLRALGFVGAVASIVCVLRVFIAVAVPRLLEVHRSGGSSDHRLVSMAASIGDKAAIVSLLFSVGMWITAILAATWLGTAWRRSISAFMLAVLLTGISWSAGVAHLLPTLLVLLACVLGVLLFVRGFQASLGIAMSGAMLCAAVLSTAVWSVTEFDSKLPAYVGDDRYAGLMRGALFSAAFLLAPALCAGVVVWLDARTAPKQEAI